MFIKMRENKGFTLVELMIVVAIVGILAAVAVPFYQNYINKSRLTAYVFPGVHSIQTNVGNWFSFKNKIPTATNTVNQMMADADTSCFNVNITGGSITITIDSSGGTRCANMQKMHNQELIMSAHTQAGIIQSWEIMPTTLSVSLGLAGEGA